MKKIKLCIALLFCALKLHSQQKEFEDILGKQNVKTLNFLLQDFEENILKKRYPSVSLQDAYHKLITEVSEEKLLPKELLSKKMKNTFDKSILKKQIYCLTDTVFVGNSRHGVKKTKGKAIIASYKCLNPNGRIINTRAEFYFNDNKKSINETLSFAKNSSQVNLTGKYLKALQGVKNKSQFLKKYIEFIENTGDLRHPITLSSILARENIKLDNFLIKRIILINIIYN
ncbi:conserved hypothetical protein [Tenacibaculum sp. 190524A05c]|uniref:hypothetical protein n=1 Tax=Tenacibaculum platacis TaxID=3137852 RepID=UPI0031FA525D